MSNPTVGFVNADGSGNTLLNSDMYLAKAALLDNSNTLYGLSWNGAIEAGRLSVWRQGEPIRTCQNGSWWQITSLSLVPEDNGSMNVLINSSWTQILLVDPESCQPTTIYIDVSEPDQRRFVWGGSLSQGGEFLLYAYEGDRRAVQSTYILKKLDIDTGVTTDIGNGINPEWSPDNQWIAYINVDGIYLMAADGTQKRKLVGHELRNSPESTQFRPSAPYPRWSPDGKSLAYHICDLSCYLYVLDIANGAEQKLLDSEGLNPYWRYP
jgi:dipeptidyl aminopeptidase/acylaminoacyl peptidase